jgi:hypothetical protein
MLANVLLYNHLVVVLNTCLHWYVGIGGTHLNKTYIILVRVSTIICLTLLYVITGDNFVTQNRSVPYILLVEWFDVQM